MIPASKTRNAVQRLGSPEEHRNAWLRDEAKLDCQAIFAAAPVEVSPSEIERNRMVPCEHLRFTLSARCYVFQSLDCLG